MLAFEKFRRTLADCVATCRSIWLSYIISRRCRARKRSVLALALSPNLAIQKHILMVRVFHLEPRTRERVAAASLERKKGKAPPPIFHKFTVVRGDTPPTRGVSRVVLEPHHLMKVLVIGAGPSGLAATKECLVQGFDVDCVEAVSYIGGVFGKDKSACYDDLYLTTSNVYMAFSDFPCKDPNLRYSRKDECAPAALPAPLP